MANGNDPIVNAAYRDLMEQDEQIEEAQKLLRIMREAGEDVTKETAHINTLMARRNKLMTALKQNGATTEE